MKNLKVCKFNPSVLRNATLICDGSGYMRTYNLNNGLIYKEIKSKDSSSLNNYLFFDDFINSLENKLNLASKLPEDHLVLPNSIYMNKNGIVGYTVPYVNYECFDTLLKKMNSLEDITNMFVLLCNAVKEENKYGIIFPDLGNASNILYDRKNNRIKFIDFDGIQIGDYDSFNVSSLMSKYYNPIFEEKKYFDKNTTLFTSNFDKASLLALFLFYTTRTNMTNFNLKDFKSINNRIVLNRKALCHYIEMIGLRNSSIEDELLNVYDYDSSNNYIETSIKRLIKTHNLDFNKHVFNVKH